MERKEDKSLENIKEENNIDKNNSNNINSYLNELNKISDSLSIIANNSEKRLIDLSHFFQTLSYEFSQLNNNINIPKNNNENKLKDLYEHHTNIFSKLNTVSENINMSILLPLKNGLDNYKEERKKINKILGNIKEQIEYHQKCLNEFEEKLYDEKYKNEKNINNQSPNKIKEMEQIYNKESEVMQKIFNDSKKDFDLVINLFNQNETTLDSLISACVSIYVSLIKKELNGEYDKFIKLNDNNNEKFNSLTKIKENNNLLFENEWKFITNLNYDKYKSNKESNDKDINSVDKGIKSKSNNKSNSSKDIRLQKILKAKLARLKLNEKNNNDTENQKQNLENKIDDDLKKCREFVDIIKNQENIQIDIINKIMSIIDDYTNIEEFYREFLKIFNEKDNNNLIEFKCFDNLVYLTNIFNKIILNLNITKLENKKKILNNEHIYNKNNDDAYKILDDIIKISENTFFDDTFVCALLNKNEIFKDIDLWHDLLYHKIINYIRKYIKNHYKKDTNINSNINKPKIIQKGTKIIGNIFNNFVLPAVGVKNNGDYPNNIYKNIHEIESLNNEQKLDLFKNANLEYHKAIKIYVVHMSNFKIKNDNIVDLIFNVFNELNINDNEMINFYFDFINSNAYSTKKNINNKNNIETIKNSEINEKITDIKSNNQKSILNKYPLEIKEDKSKIIILLSTLKYLQNIEKIKFFNLKKTYADLYKGVLKDLLNYEIKDNYYKNIDISMEKHLNIWKICLKINRLKAYGYNYNNLYQEMLQTKKGIEINDTNNLNNNININKINSSVSNQYNYSLKKSFNIIELDVKRTNFKKNKENSMKCLDNVLKTFITMDKKEIHYCQGMNFLGGFLFDLTQNEEETFYLLLGLFLMTVYNQIFINDMIKLKHYFYTMDKLVYLYLPTIYYHFKSNQITMNLFVPPFFLTLFTNIYSFIPHQNENDNNKFLIKIFDGFLMEGFTIIFKSLLALLKYHEKDLLNLKNDDLVEFLINKLQRSDLFLNKNYEKFLDLKSNFNIDNSVITCIEDEISIESRIKNKLTNSIFEYLNEE